MLRNTEQILKDCRKAIQADESITTFVDLARAMGVTARTLHKHFPKGSEGHEEVWELITANKAAIKQHLRRKFYDSDSAPLLISLYKLLATPDEREALSTYAPSKVENEKPEIKIENFKPLKSDD